MEEDVRVVVGRNTRRLRKAEGLTQEQLSERAEVTQQYLSQLERGQRNPTVLMLAQIARVLSCSVLDLLRPDQA